MARNIYTRIDDNWLPLKKVFTKVNADWQEVQKVFTKVDANWQQTFPAVGSGSCPAPGDYQLAATSLSLPTHSQNGFAEFDTTPFQFSNCIKEISIILTWRNANLAISQIDVSGRPNNNFYREIENVLREWDGRVITHRIDTFDATSLTDFNSGAAIGFNLSSFYLGQEIGELVSNVQLKLVT